MTNPDYTHMLIVVDRSGSMSSIAADMRGGLDSLFSEQAKLDGDVLVDYVQFDTEYSVVFTDRPVSKAKAVLEPRGMTALLDAVGKGVTDLGIKLAAKAENDRPGNVMVIIVTDGYENSSREWTYDTVKSLVERQTSEYSWDFVFLGANIDAPAVGAQFGIQAGKAMTYDTANTDVTMSNLNAYTTRFRSGEGSNTEFSDSERKSSVNRS